jgi:hypothetical protein
VRLESGGQLSAVERVAVGCGDLLECGGLFGKPEPLTGFGRPPGGHEGGREAGLLFEQRYLRRPLFRDGR